MRRSLLIFIFLFLTAPWVPGQERYVKPVDEASEDPSFLLFRTRLIAAAEKRDIRYVKGVMAPNIKLSFGGHDGVKHFDGLWTDKNKFWREFLSVIKNGGHWLREGGRRTMFTAPYSFDGFPEELDSFEYFVIFGSDVNLRRSPGMDGEIIGKLSYNVVKLSDDPANRAEKPEWFSITTLGGQSGYVSVDYVRSPIDYRAGFEKRRGRWVMTFFLAGD